jgi:hypothetical protein
LKGVVPIVYSELAPAVQGNAQILTAACDICNNLHVEHNANMHQSYQIEIPKITWQISVIKEQKI